MDIRALDRAYIAGTYDRYEPVLVSGHGSLVYDEAGRRYIDMGSGIAVNAFGVADAAWAEAVAQQARRLQHACNKYYTAPQAQLAEQLCARTGMRKVFFCNSGAEANECALKVARKYGSDRYGAARPTIITLENSFHGRTIATLAATGQEAMHRDFGPFPPGFRHVKAGDVRAMEQAFDGTVCGVLIELVQGEGGVRALDGDFLRGVEALCREKDMLFCIDEVQTGNGRTGSLYAWMQYGFKPDIMSTAKGLGGGLPIGACLFGEKTEHVLTAGTHGSTFGGNPVVCAGALTILDRIDDKLLADVKAKSAYLFEAFTGAPGIKAVTGMGLMIGLQTEKPAAEVVAACMANGVLVLTAHGRVRLLPALNIPMELVKKAAEVIRAACA